MVRRAQALGLKSEIDRDIGRFYPLYASSVRDLGTPAYPPAYFSALLEVFGSDCEILTVLRKAGRSPACLASISGMRCFRTTVAAVAAARRLAANDFMYWEVMRRACERGARVFDFGRSKIEHRRLRLQADLGVRAGTTAPRVSVAAHAGDAQSQPAEPEIRFSDRGVAPSASVCRQRARPRDLARPGIR